MGYICFNIFCYWKFIFTMIDNIFMIFLSSFSVFVLTLFLLAALLLPLSSTKNWAKMHDRCGPRPCKNSARTVAGATKIHASAARCNKDSSWLPDRFQSCAIPLALGVFTQLRPTTPWWRNRDERRDHPSKATFSAEQDTAGHRRFRSFEERGASERPCKGNALADGPSFLRLFLSVRRRPIQVLNSGRL